MSRTHDAEAGRRVRGYLALVFSRQFRAKLVAILLLVAAVAFAGDEIARHLGALEAWVSGLGLWGVVAFVALLVLATSVIVPSSLFSLMAGALFGVLLGSEAVVTGYLLASSLQFALAHRVLRERIQRRIDARPALVAIQRAVMSREFALQALLRLTPVNPALLSYTLGAAGVRFAPFLAATLVHVPNLCLEVYVGYAGKHATELVASGSAPVHLREWALLCGLVASVVVMFWVSRLARKAIAAAISESAK